MSLDSLTGIHAVTNLTACLAAASDADNAAVVVQTCNGSVAQSWSYTNGTIRVFSDKCMDVTGGSNSFGNLMSVLTCQPGDRNQQFNYTYPTIQWVGSNPLECLDLTNGSIANGNIVQMFGCSGGINQAWNLVSATVPPPSSPPPAAPPAHKKSNAGAIAGGVVGGVLGIAAVAALVIFFFFRRRRPDPVVKEIDPPVLAADADMRVTPFISPTNASPSVASPASRESKILSPQVTGAVSETLVANPISPAGTKAQAALLAQQSPRSHHSANPSISTYPNSSTGPSTQGKREEDAGVSFGNGHVDESLPPLYRSEWSRNMP